MSKEECLKPLSGMRHDKSPGFGQIYECFWDEIGDDVVHKVNNPFNNHS